VNDIALIKFAKRVDFLGKDKHLKPINLPKKNQNSPKDFECIVSGWVITNDTKAV
jgi:hypothetical protein